MKAGAPAAATSVPNEAGFRGGPLEADVILKAPGSTIAQALLLRADEVIE